MAFWLALPAPTDCMQIATNPLTPRLAGPPLPQGGEGQRFVSFQFDCSPIWTPVISSCPLLGSLKRSIYSPPGFPPGAPEVHSRGVPRALLQTLPFLPTRSVRHLRRNAARSHGLRCGGCADQRFGAGKSTKRPPGPRIRRTSESTCKGFAMKPKTPVITAQVKVPSAYGREAASPSRISRRPFWMASWLRSRATLTMSEL